MLVAIIGGKLQGVELACLAREAGWETLLVDRNTRTPAEGICDHVLRLNIEKPSDLDGALEAADLIIPALENQAALDHLVTWAQSAGHRKAPVAFDSTAYALSSSKIDTNRLFTSLGIPTPEPWPRCGFPLVAKPSYASGSTGVTILKDQKDAEKRFPGGFPKKEWVLQQYIDGPSFSLEVIGRPGAYLPLLVTELFMDTIHDCRAVTAPCRLTPDQRHCMAVMAVKIAAAIGLTGIMDLEVILNRGALKVLEIDARFPSQTPLAVHAATGCNMVEMLADLFLSKKLPQWDAAKPLRETLLEHIRVTSDAIHMDGEHVMAASGPLHQVPGFFGSDTAITNYQAGNPTWVATMIYTGTTRREVMDNRNRGLAAIRNQFHMDKPIDPFPRERP